MPVVVNSRLTIPDDELEWRFSPSGGPGGQHANRAHTRVELSWDPNNSAVARDLSETHRDRLQANVPNPIRLTVDQYRSQHRNRTVAEERLAERVRAALAPPPKARRATKPSKGAKRRRLEAKRRTGRTKKLRRRPGVDD